MLIKSIKTALCVLLIFINVSCLQIHIDNYIKKLPPKVGNTKLVNIIYTPPTEDVEEIAEISTNFSHLYTRSVVLEKIKAKTLELGGDLVYISIIDTSSYNWKYAAGKGSPDTNLKGYSTKIEATVFRYIDKKSLISKDPKLK